MNANLHLGLLLGALLAACAKATPSATTAGTPTSVGAIPAGSAATGQATATSAESNAAEPGVGASSAEAARNMQLSVDSRACVRAHIEGSVGNCTAPSLVVEDTCEKRVYVLDFNDCYASESIDTKGLSLDSRILAARVLGAGGTPADRANSLPIVAIRGSVTQPHSVLAGSTFQLDVDFVERGQRVTKHLEGVTTAHRFATNQ